MADSKEKKQTKKDIFFDCVVTILKNNCPMNNHGICLSAAFLGKTCSACNCYYETYLEETYV